MERRFGNNSLKQHITGSSKYFSHNPPTRSRSIHGNINTLSHPDAPSQQSIFEHVKQLQSAATAVLEIKRHKAIAEAKSVARRVHPVSLEVIGLIYNKCEHKGSYCFHLRVGFILCGQT